MKTHEHKTVREVECCFSGPIPSAKYNPAAHGGVCFVETCSCGAERRTNINGMHVEAGKWMESEQ